MKPERIQKQLQAHPGWNAAYPTQQLVRNYSFPSFHYAVRFVNLVASSGLTKDGDLFVMWAEGGFRPRLQGIKGRGFQPPASAMA